jgi:hypothetical protein
MTFLVIFVQLRIVYVQTAILFLGVLNIYQWFSALKTYFSLNFFVPHTTGKSLIYYCLSHLPL